MKTKKRITDVITAISLALLIITTGALFAGCGSANGSGSDKRGEAEKAVPTSGVTITASDSRITLGPGELSARVISVDGNAVTVSVSPQGGPGGQGGMTPPDMKDGENGLPGGMTPPGMQNGENGLPDGMTPPDMQDGENGFGRGGDGVTAVITLTDGSVLRTSDGGEASLSDLTEGSLLTVTVGENGSVTSIVIGESGGADLTGIAGGV